MGIQWTKLEKVWGQKTAETREIEYIYIIKKNNSIIQYHTLYLTSPSLPLSLSGLLNA